MADDRLVVIVGGGLAGWRTADVDYDVLVIATGVRARELPALSGQFTSTPRRGCSSTVSCGSLTGKTADTLGPEVRQCPTSAVPENWTARYLWVFAQGIGCGTARSSATSSVNVYSACHAEAIDMLPTAADWHPRSRNLPRHS